MARSLVAFFLLFSSVVSLAEDPNSREFLDLSRSVKKKFEGTLSFLPIDADREWPYLTIGNSTLKIQTANRDMQALISVCEDGAQCVVTGRRVKGADGDYLLVDKFETPSVVEAPVSRATKRVFPKLLQEVSSPQLMGAAEKSAGFLLFRRNLLSGTEVLIEAKVPSVLKEECNWYFTFERPIEIKDGMKTGRVFGIGGKSDPAIEGSDPLRVAMVVEDDRGIDVAWVVVRGGDASYLSLGGDHETDEWTRLEVRGKSDKPYPFLDRAFQLKGEERAKIYADSKLAREAEPSVPAEIQP